MNQAIKGTFNFESDLKRAQIVERRLGELLRAREHVKQVEFNDDRRFDLRVTKHDGSSYTIEVKHDMVSNRSGNVGVEFKCRGKPSGIDTSEADYWVFLLDNTFHIIATKRLRAFIEDVRFTAIGRGGDENSRTAMYLFPKMELVNQMQTLGYFDEFLTWEEIGAGKS